jgi:hypothetical protein
MSVTQDEPPILIHAIGTPALLANGAVEGIVTAVCLRQKDAITYQVSWWDGASYKFDWFTPFELQFNAQAQKRIGFHQARQA